jgi:hypothetical protein
MPEYVSIPEAARRLGLSKSAVRRRLQSGQLEGRQEQRPQGHVWLIALPQGSPNGGSNGAIHTAAQGPAPAGTFREVPGGADTSRQVPREVPAGAAAGGAGTALQRAQEMAAYSEALLAPYVRRIEEQAERLGRLENELEHVQTERDAARAELEQAHRQAEEARQETEETVRLAEEAAQLRRAPLDEKRPWWRFW